MDYIRRLPVLSKENCIGQLLRYAIVGGIASLADITIFTVCTNIFQIHYLVSNIFSFLCGLLINYFLSREWVFNKKIHDFGRDFIIFSVIGVIGLILSSTLLYMMIRLRILYYLLPMHSDSLVKSTAKLSTIVIVFLWNFFARKKMVFSV